MKFVRQLFIILLICFIGELLKSVIPLPIPAGIYGMVLLFLALELKIMKLETIGDTAKFLIDIMAVMFIPAGVGLLTTWDTLKSIWFRIFIISVISTVVVMGVTGVVTQAIMRKGKK